MRLYALSGPSGAVLAVILLCLAVSAASAQSDAEVRRRIVAESIANYAGSCPCPYSRDRAGRSCGRRSAYSRPGGAAPICYPADISAEDVRAWRARR